VLYLGERIEKELKQQGKPLTGVWIDKKQRATVEGMHEGVRRSQNFILFLTEDVLTRVFCLNEIRLALKYRKNVILVFQTDERFGGVRGSFSDYYGPELTKAFPHPDDYKWLTRNSYIQCHDRGQHIDVMFRDEKCKNGILDQMDLEDSTVSPLSTSSHFSRPVSVALFPYTPFPVLCRLALDTRMAVWRGKSWDWFRGTQLQHTQRRREAGRAASHCLSSGASIRLKMRFKAPTCLTNAHSRRRM
jgi:hypothetical protein